MVNPFGFALFLLVFAFDFSTYAYLTTEFPQPSPDGIIQGIRLSGGTSTFGRVEILFNGEWGTVCDNGWDLNDAHVACMQLGFPYALYSYGSAVFGPGSGRIWMDKVNCNGQESTLSDCQHNGFGNHDCSHSEDAGVYCEGRLCNSNPCDNGGTCFDLPSSYNCTCSSEFTGPRCEVPIGNPCQPNPCFNGGLCFEILSAFLCVCPLDFMGEMCEVSLYSTTEIPQRATLSTIQGIRLAGGSSSAGRVEVLYDGVWGTVCDDSWDINDARVVCMHLGYPDAIASYSNAFFGSGSGRIWMDNVQCDGYESSLSDCVHNGFGIHNCGHSEDAGVLCEDSATTTSTSICSNSEFTCYDGSCIPDRYVCDSIQDCPGKEDELNCYYTPSSTPETHTPTATPKTNTNAATPKTQSESIFVTSNYYLTSPNYPSDYPNNIRLIWYLSTYTGSQLLLTFIAIDTEDKFDHITVRNSTESFSGELLLRWSGAGSPYEAQILSYENFMSVTFETDGTVRRNGFAAVLEVTSLTEDELDCGEEFDCQNGVCLPQERVCDNREECGNGADENNENCTVVTDTCSFSEFTCSTGSCIPQSWLCDGIQDCPQNEDEYNCYDTTTVTPNSQSESIFVISNYFLTSPNYPSDYPNYFRNTWYFSTYTGLQLLLTFIAIDTEDKFDHIIVRNGTESFSGELLFRWSGAGSPYEAKILSYENFMSVTFETDGTVRRKGFAAVLEVTSLTEDELDCGEEFDCQNGVCLPQARVCDDREECGNDADENNENCTAVPATCSYSDFTCSNGFCIPQSGRCDGIKDCPDNEDEYNCFYTTTVTPVLQFESIFVTSNYYLTSPNYPSDYPNNFRFTWYFSTYTSVRLLLTFIAIDTEDNFDHIIVRNGTESFSGELLLRWSGAGSPYEAKILSYENFMSVTFETDGVVRRNGFAAVLEVTSLNRDELDCGEEFDCQNGVCLPQERVCNNREECGNDADENNANCTVVTATCLFSEFTCSNGSCIPQSGLCDGIQDCPDNEDEYNCSQSEAVFVTSNYYLTSPNYPTDYPNNLRFTWYFSTYNGLQLLLTFIAIETEDKFDHITVRNGNESLRGDLLLRWSGTGSPYETKILSYENIMSVTFETDTYVRRKGFAAVVEVTSLTRDELDCGEEFDCQNGVCLPQERVCDDREECGNGADENNENCTVVTDTTTVTSTTDYEDIFVASAHYFTSPNYPSEYPNSLSYTWYFSTYPGLKLLLTFIDIKTETYYDYITVRDGNASLSEEPLLRLSGEGSPNEFRILSYGSDMLVTLETDFIVQRDGFAALVVVTCLITDELDCGEEFSCYNGVCLSQDRVCNRQNECGNNADESKNYCPVDYTTEVLTTDFPLETSFDDTREVFTTDFPLETSLAPPTVANCPQNSITESVTFRTAATAVFWIEPTATSNAGGFITVSRTHNPGDQFSVGETTVVYTFTDNPSQLTTTCTFIVIVQIGVVDTAPSIPLCPNVSSVISFFGNIGNFVSWTIGDCFDLEDGSITPVCDPISGSFFDVGFTPVMCTCTDSDSLSSECTFDAVIVGVAPSIPLCPNVSSVISFFGNIGNFVSWTIGNCSDLEDGSITPVCDPISGSFFDVGFTPVVCTCTDSDSLSSECTFDAVIVGENSPSVCPNGVPTPQFSTPCLCDPGFGGDNCDVVTTTSGPVSCPSNGVTTFGTSVTYPEPSGVPAGFELIFRTFQSGSNDLPFGENELLLVYLNGSESYFCRLIITVTV